jgi:hypothetical protein
MRLSQIAIQITNVSAQFRSAFSDRQPFGQYQVYQVGLFSG